MTEEEIIRMAREAGFDALLPSEEILGRGGIYTGSDDEISDELERFAALVADAEREACAKVCEHMAKRCSDIRTAALEMAAENIRARGNS